MSKNNVHPDYYKTAGRDRQDDAAAARQARSVAAKASSRERPDRMPKAKPGPPQASSPTRTTGRSAKKPAAGRRPPKKR